jgi:hypothetical protein
MNIEPESTVIYERVIWQDEQGFNQARLVINEFREVEYLHIRKYYLSFEGDFEASNQGICMPLDLDITKELFKGLAEVISLAESREVIEEYFGDTIREIYCK